MQAELRGAGLSGKPALLLRDVLTTMRPADLKVTEPGNPNVGAFQPTRGKAVQCYNKATEASAYFLQTELLVREGGRATVLPYAGMRAEVRQEGRRSPHAGMPVHTCPCQSTHAYACAHATHPYHTNACQCMPTRRSSHRPVGAPLRFSLSAHRPPRPALWARCLRSR